MDHCRTYPRIPGEEWMHNALDPVVVYKGESYTLGMYLLEWTRSIAILMQKSIEKSLIMKYGRLLISIFHKMTLSYNMTMHQYIVQDLCLIT